MELSPEDTLRINVMMNNAQAVRINENNMTVYVLNDEREAHFQLNPNCRSDKYLRNVRELLSTLALGSPRGYPVFLRRWVRMGQANNMALDKLLMLGEPEAVVAVACSPGLSDELARRAWWSLPSAEVARRMLESEAVVQGTMGRILAEFLLEFLPFEEEPSNMMQSVRLVLQPGLMDAKAITKIWNMGGRKKAIRVGFLHAVPDDLPIEASARADLPVYADALSQWAAQGNVYARVLLRTLAKQGQAFLQGVQDALQRPVNQEVMAALMDAIGSYFQDLRSLPETYEEIEKLEQEVKVLLSQPKPAALSCIVQAFPQLSADIHALLVLAHINEKIIFPVLARSSAVGSVLRKQLQPITEPIQAQLSSLEVARSAK